MRRQTGHTIHQAIRVHCSGGTNITKVLWSRDAGGELVRAHVVTEARRWHFTVTARSHIYPTKRQGWRAVSGL